MPYSDAMKEELHRTSGTEPVLLAIEITHDDLTTPVRVVNDTQDLLSNGNTFMAVPFGFVLPDNLEQGNSSARLEIDNVGRELVQWLELSSGGSGARVTMMQLLRSAPDVVEWSVTMDLTSISMDSQKVSATLGFKNLLDMPAVAITYTPAVAPGLF